jgi:DNA invertase Pin-like site-specific DNA recombinase
MSLETKPEKRLIGYARVSTQQQDLAWQTKALKRLAKGESTRDLAKSYGVSVSTISRLNP